ncbi:MAG: MMPL family transporter [Gaiellaceae bacterium]|jgi:RND superfamily putative drug exporter
MGRLNLAGRAGRWSAENWKKALFGWLVLAAAAMAVGNVVGHVQMPDSKAAAGETATALSMLEQAGFKQPAGESVLIQSRKQTAADPGFISAIAGVVQTLALQKNVTNIQNPLVQIGGGGQISRDGHSVLVQFTIKGDPDKAKDKVKPILDAIAGVQASNPSLSVREVGNASANYELGKRFSKDFANAERLTIPITLIILLAAFGALVAAGLPVLLAFSAVLASLGIYALITHAYSGDYQSTSAVVLLIGMAVGVDYSLFYLRREREERAAGREPRSSLLRAASTSGQAVVISGATVLIAMAGMFIAGNRIFTSFAIGTMLVVLCAVIGSVTVLPATLARLGDRVDRGRVPFFGRRTHAAGESRFWADRRDDHPRRAASRRDEAARRVELVHAALARVGAVTLAGGGRGAGPAAPAPARTLGG